MVHGKGGLSHPLFHPQHRGSARAMNAVNPTRRSWLLLWCMLAGCGVSSHARPAQCPPADVPPLQHGLQRAGPGDVGLDAGAVKRLVDLSRDQHSNALVLLKDGKLVVEEYAGGNADTPVFAMSVSKSVVAMAYGALLTSGRLKSLDMEISTWLPELKATDKGRITLQQLMTHTSGLDPTRADWEHESIVQHVLRANLVFTPGTQVQYNNNACDLLAALFPRLSGGWFLDDHLQQTIFGPLGVVAAHWVKDIHGAPRGAGEFAVRPIDLAKLGQLMLNGGEWNGQRILSTDWVRSATSPGQPWFEAWGQLWWRHAEYDYSLSSASLEVWRDLDVETKHMDAVKGLVGRRFPDRKSILEAVAAAVGPTEFDDVKRKLESTTTRAPFDKLQRGDLRAYYGEGWLGQYLVVVPDAGIVAVRMRALDEVAQRDPMKDAFGSFPAEVARLAHSR